MSQASDALRRVPHLPERRAFPRSPGPLINVDLGENRTGVILDLSEGGMAVQISHGLELGSEMPVQFRISIAEPAIQTRGRTAWLNSSGKAAGIEFLELSTTDRDQLKRWSQSAVIPDARPWAESPTPAFFETRPGNLRNPIAEPGPADDLFKVKGMKSGVSRTLWVILLVGGLLIAAAFFTVARHRSSVKMEASRSENPAPAAESPAASEATAATAPIPESAAPQPVTQQTAPAPSIVAPPRASHKSAARASGSFLQIAALRQKENADALVETLRKKQYPVLIHRRGDSVLYFVVVGPFTDAASSDRFKEALTRDGYQPFAVHVSPQQ
jgi:cell division septation protein DedD